MLDVDEHLKARGYYAYIEHPKAGVHAHDGPPSVLSKTPGAIRCPARSWASTRNTSARRFSAWSDEGIAELMVAGALA